MEGGSVEICLWLSGDGFHWVHKSFFACCWHKFGKHFGIENRIDFFTLLKLFFVALSVFPLPSIFFALIVVATAINFFFYVLFILALRNSVFYLFIWLVLDLRQDMLTLQAMRIMDALWKKCDMELSMNIYAVLPMGKNVCFSYQYMLVFLSWMLMFT